MSGYITSVCMCSFHVFLPSRSCSTPQISFVMSDLSNAHAHSKRASPHQSSSEQRGTAASDKKATPNRLHQTNLCKSQRHGLIQGWFGLKTHDGFAGGPSVWQSTLRAWKTLFFARRNAICSPLRLQFGRVPGSVKNNPYFKDHTASCTLKLGGSHVHPPDLAAPILGAPNRPLSFSGF